MAAGRCRHGLNVPGQAPMEQISAHSSRGLATLRQRRTAPPVANKSTRAAQVGPTSPQASWAIVGAAL